MPQKKRWPYFLIALLLVLLAIVFFSPALVARGVRYWLTRNAQADACTIRIGKIEAPLGRPIVLHDLHLTSEANAASRITVDLREARAEINLASLFHFSRARLLRRFTAEGVRIVIAPPERKPATAQRFDWAPLQFLVADRFEISGPEMRLENSNGVLALNSFRLDASELQAGNFSAGELNVETPWFHKSFPQLRGATAWQESRLTIGALSLMTGLDLESVVIDMGHLGERRLTLQTTADAFGGKLRATISSEDHPDHRTWDLAGTAAEVSLAQLSDGLEMPDRASGLLHASKFTFRGNGAELADSTASIWAEISGLTWRDRTADTIMLGAALYNRALHIEQLYVKQRKNQLTASGESALPQKSADWLNPDFHGDISASLNDLGDFARLFGANPPDFAGEVSINGNVSAQDRKLGGQLQVEGKALRLFGAAVGACKARVNLKESQLEIEECELQRDQDFFKGHGTIDMRAPHSYSAEFSASLAQLEKYRALIPAAWRVENPEGSLTADWRATGKSGEHNGAFHIRGAALRAKTASWLQPFDAEFEGDYTREKIFFRQFALHNEHASLTAFVGVAENYLQVQALDLEINGQPALDGNVFLPVSFSHAYATSDWLGALAADPIFDLNLVLHPTDLATATSALARAPFLSGNAQGLLAFSGKLDALAGDANLQLQNFSWNDPARFSATIDARVAAGSLSLKTSASFGGSAPVELGAMLPLQFEKRDAGYALARDGAVAGTLDFPTLLLAKLPRAFSFGIAREGILSGRLSISDSLSHPSLAGEMQLIDGKFANGNRASSKVTFAGKTATIDFFNLTSGNVSESARGEIDFSDLKNLSVRFLPVQTLSTAELRSSTECVGPLRFSAQPLRGSAQIPIREIDFHGALGNANWQITLGSGADGAAQTFAFCPDGEPLWLQTVPTFGF